MGLPGPVATHPCQLTGGRVLQVRGALEQWRDFLLLQVTRTGPCGRRRLQSSAFKLHFPSTSALRLVAGQPVLSTSDSLGPTGVCEETRVHEVCEQNASVSSPTPHSRVRDTCSTPENATLDDLGTFTEVLQTRHGTIPIWCGQEECTGEVAHSAAGILCMPTGVTTVEQCQANGR